MKFITSFGADSDEEGGVVQGPSLPTNSKSAAKKRASQREPSKCETPWSVFEFLVMTSSVFDCGWE